LLAAADGPEEVQRKALAVFADRLATVLNEIENGEGLEIARKDALTWLREAKRHTFWKGRHQI
jgi:hypothetical protein